jgi:parvulin-like peptidyl-prolyl isomerase
MLALLAGGAAGAPDDSMISATAAGIVARVNGEPITRGELQGMLAHADLRRQLQRELGARKPDGVELERLAVQKLIDRRLMLQEARRRSVAVPDRYLDQATAALRHRFKDPRMFAVWAKTQGLDRTSLREAIRTEVLVRRVQDTLVSGVQLDEEEVQAYYEAHPDERKTPEQLRLQLVAIEDAAASAEIVAAMQKGEELDRLIRDRAEHLGPLQSEEVGWLSIESLEPLVREAVETLRPGESAGAVRDDGTSVIVRVVERRPAGTMSLAEARPGIERRLLTAKRLETVQAWLVAQRQRSRIEVYLRPGSFATGAAQGRSLENSD